MQVEFKDVTFVYNKKSPMEYEALKNINLVIDGDKITAIVGRTGSGKSTLIQHINALIRPTSGEVHIGDFVNQPKKRIKNKEIKQLRKRVGMVFQFPEYQLFEETVEKDVAFAPKNFGMSREESIEAARNSLLKVGLDESFFERSPFELSGGEKRKVAIAGILAAKPDLLILDEPTAGLDPMASLETMELFTKIHNEGTSILIVTHDMDLVARYCEHVIVVDDGKIQADTVPNKLFASDLSDYALELPLLYQFSNKLKSRGLNIDNDSIKCVEDLAKQIKECINE